MSGRSRVERIAASPTVVGAITTLILIVAVFLAYNASNGLPFVPVYRVSAELPNASRLVRNNEVRLGGHRVGVIESVQTSQSSQTGEAAAKLNLKLDKAVKPLPVTTQVRVRYKSSFGLKYLELVRRPGPPLAEGGTLPVSQAVPQTEFDAINNTFDTNTRENIRQNLEGYGNAFAARGASLNQAIEALNPLFENLGPVARKLAAPKTRLKRFFPELADSARIVAPVAIQNSELFTNMATTWAAISSDPKALRDTISSGVPALETGIRTLPEQGPFLTDFTEASRLLRPGVRDLRGALPTFNDALAIGTPVLKRTPAVNRSLEGVFNSLNALVSDPSTKISLIRLTDLFDNVKPTAEFIAPYQTVCNYFNYWFTFLTEHITQLDTVEGAGTTERVQLIGTPSGPPLRDAIGGQEGPVGGYSGIQANGVAVEQGPQPQNGEFSPHEAAILHGDSYAPAVDAAGNPDCQRGQSGYTQGDLPVRDAAGGRAQAIGNPAQVTRDIPGSRGRTGLYYRRDGSRVFNHDYPTASP
jgi:phospholipid/cholesterol/gamma-HCH transport system substrate-binding protein